MSDVYALHRIFRKSTPRKPVGQDGLVCCSQLPSRASNSSSNRVSISPSWLSERDTEIFFPPNFAFDPDAQIGSTCKRTTIEVHETKLPNITAL